jgi:hypothetical protein
MSVYLNDIAMPITKCIYGQPICFWWEHKFVIPHLEEVRLTFHLSVKDYIIGYTKIQ